MYLISACLTGIKCRYDGNNVDNNKLWELVEAGKAIAVCPEIMGGLSTPRDPCEIVSDLPTITTKEGIDCTKAYMDGAGKTLKICKLLGITKVILKSKSPSCGSREIYDGSFTGKVIPGSGVTARLLRQAGIEVYDENNWMDNLD